LSDLWPTPARLGFQFYFIITSLANKWQRAKIGQRLSGFDWQMFENNKTMYD